MQTSFLSEKAREVLNEYLRQGDIHTDACDVENYFSDETQIKYLEFNSIKEAERALAAAGKIKSLLVVVYAGDGELKMNELLEILSSLSAVSGLDFENLKMLYNTVSKSPAGLLRLLAQIIS